MRTAPALLCALYTGLFATVFQYSGGAQLSLDLFGIQCNEVLTCLDLVDTPFLNLS